MAKRQPFQSTQSLDPELDYRIKSVINEMARRGHRVKVISKVRTADEQKKLYTRGRSTKGSIVTEKSGEPGDESLHQLGRAADFAFVDAQGRVTQNDKDPWDVLGEVAKEQGLDWGGDWKTLVDRPHTQLRPRAAKPERGMAARGFTDPSSVKKSQIPSSIAPDVYDVDNPTEAPGILGSILEATRPPKTPTVARGFTDPESTRVSQDRSMTARGFTDLEFTRVSEPSLKRRQFASSLGSLASEPGRAFLDLDDSQPVPTRPSPMTARGFPSGLGSRSYASTGSLVSSPQPTPLEAVGDLSQSTPPSPSPQVAKESPMSQRAVYPIKDKTTGKTYRMQWDGPGPPDKESIRKFVWDQENESTWHKIWKPTTDLPSRMARRISSSEALADRPEDETESPPDIDFGGEVGMPSNLARKVIRGGINTIGDVGTQMTSPGDIALTLATLGSGTAARAGLAGTSRALTNAARLGGGALTAEGVYKMGSGLSNEDIGEVGAGALETVGGAFGMRTPYRALPKSTATPRPAPTALERPRPSGPTARWKTRPRPTSYPPAEPPAPIDAEFRVVGERQLGGRPEQRALPALNDRGLAPAPRTFYGGSRGLSENLEDVGELGTTPNTRDILEQTSPYGGGRGVQYERKPEGRTVLGREIGDVSDVVDRVPPATLTSKPSTIPPSQGKGPIKGKTESNYRPFKNTDDRSLEYFAFTEKDPEAIAEIKLRPGLRERLKKLLGEEKGELRFPFDPGEIRQKISRAAEKIFPEQARTDLKKIRDDLAKSGLSIIRDLNGEDLKELIIRNRLDAEQFGGRIISRLKEITKDLTPEELANYIEMRDTGAAPISQAVADAFSRFRVVDRRVSDAMRASGVSLKTAGGKRVPWRPLSEEGSYWPHIYPQGYYKDRKRALETIMDQGYTLKEAETILKNSAEHGERLIDPQYARRVNAPGYRKDIGADYQHYDDMSRRIMQAHDFGPMDTAEKGSPISRMIAVTDDPIRVGKIVNRYLGREEPMDPSWARFNRAVVKFQVATKLSKFMINNTAQIAMLPARAGFKNTGKALAKTLFDYKGSKSQAEVMGVYQSIYREILREATEGPSGLARWFGITKSEEFNRTVAGLAGKYTAPEIFAKAKANPTDKLMAQLEDLIQENPWKLIRQDALTDWQVNRAGGRMAEISQGRASNIDLPPIWSDHPAARLSFLFKRYAFQQSKNLYEAAKIMGPFRTAAIMIGTGTIMGEPLGDINATLRGTGRWIGGAGDWQDEVRKAIAERGEGFKRMINNLGQAWTLGYIGDLLESSARSPAGTATNLAGPVIGDIGETAYNVGTGNIRGLAAMGARAVPLVGTGLASAIRESDQRGGGRGGRGGRSGRSR